MNWLKQKLSSAWTFIKKWWAVVIGGLVITTLAATTPAIPEDLQIKCDKDKILFDKTSNDITSYLCISNVEVPAEENEELSKRTKNTQFWKIGEEKDKKNIRHEIWTAKVFIGEPFYKDEVQKKWFLTENGTTTKESFDKQVKPSLLESLFGLPVYALETTTFSGAGDGDIFADDGFGGSWDIAHDKDPGNSVTDTGTTALAWSAVEEGGAVYSIFRLFLPFDTSVLPEGITINNATLTAYVAGTSDSDNDGDDFIGVVQTNASDTIQLFVEDFDQCGDAVDNPTEGATRIDIGNLVGSATNSWTLNATGMGWISTTGYTELGLREGHDIIDSAMTGANSYNYAQIRTSEYAGTTYDPYLEINYTLPVIEDTWGTITIEGDLEVKSGDITVEE